MRLSAIMPVVIVLLALSPAGAQSAQGSEQRAIVAEDGVVVTCFGSGVFVFADRCVGPARIEYVYPIKEGPIVWKTAKGEISHDDKDACGFETRARAVGDTKAETMPNRAIRILDPHEKALRERVYSAYTGGGKGEAAVEAAFALDLDGSGELVFFVVNDAAKVAEKFEADQTPAKYSIIGGIYGKDWGTSANFYYESSMYQGATDAIGRIDFVGLTRLDPSSNEMALVVDSGNPFSRQRSVVRLAHNLIFSIITPDLSCM